MFVQAGVTCLQNEHTLTFPAVTTGTPAITFNTVSGVLSIHSTDNAQAGTFTFDVVVNILLDTATTVQSVTYSLSVVITVPAVPPTPPLPLPPYVQPPEGVDLD